MYTIPNNYYTLDATAGTITLLSPYNDIDLEQFITIVDLDTNDVIYDVHLKRDGVSYSSGVITYTADNNITSDTDTIRIMVEDSGDSNINLEKIASAIDDSGDTPYINVSGVDGGTA
jgi:hypothetical protein